MIGPAPAPAAHWPTVVAKDIGAGCRTRRRENANAPSPPAAAGMARVRRRVCDPFGRARCQQIRSCASRALPRDQRVSERHGLVSRECAAQERACAPASADRSQPLAPTPQPRPATMTGNANSRGKTYRCPARSRSASSRHVPDRTGRRTQTTARRSPLPGCGRSSSRPKRRSCADASCPVRSEARLRARSAANCAGAVPGNRSGAFSSSGMNAFQQAQCEGRNHVFQPAGADRRFEAVRQGRRAGNELAAIRAKTGPTRLPTIRCRSTPMASASRMIRRPLHQAGQGGSAKGSRSRGDEGRLRRRRVRHRARDRRRALGSHSGVREKIALRCDRHGLAWSPRSHRAASRQRDHQGIDAQQAARAGRALARYLVPGHHR